MMARIGIEAAACCNGKGGIHTKPMSASTTRLLKTLIVSLSPFLREYFSGALFMDYRYFRVCALAKTIPMWPQTTWRLRIADCGI
jgi:hypothetical protein